VEAYFVLTQFDDEPDMRAAHNGTADSPTSNPNDDDHHHHDQAPLSPRPNDGSSSALAAATPGGYGVGGGRPGQLTPHAIKAAIARSPLLPGARDLKGPPKRKAPRPNG